MEEFKVPPGFTVPILIGGPPWEQLMLGGCWTLADILEFDQIAGQTLCDQEFISAIWDDLEAMEFFDE